MIGEALAGIALVKGAVDAIKSGINTANDVRDIASHLDKMFEGRDQIQKDRSKAANDPFSLKSVAQETINAKLAEEHFDEMRQLIDARFGWGTWASIIQERAKRIQEAKENEKKALIEKRKKHDELVEIGQAALLVVGVLFLVGIVFWLISRGSNGG